MTHPQHDLLVEKAGELLYRTLCEIRALTWDWKPGSEGQIEELTDITHNLPLFMIGRDPHGWVGVRERFVQYARHHWPDQDPASAEYVRIIDMDEAEFAVQYRRTTWPWPEPNTTFVG
ncbi:MAG: hypothetical protein LC104_11795 [Bacteroidales bacterium]|nr:hypothetical protein [Bacteroidales bacterium]